MNEIMLRFLKAIDLKAHAKIYENIIKMLPEGNILRNSYKKLSGSTFREICSKKCLSITKYSTKLIFSASQSLKASEKATQRLFSK